MTAKDDKAQALRVLVEELNRIADTRGYMNNPCLAFQPIATELLALRDEVAAKKAESNTLLLQVTRLMAEVSRQCPPALAVSILTAARLRPLTENKENTDASRD